MLLWLYKIHLTPLQSARFLNSDVWYKTPELVALLDALDSASPKSREDFFAQLHGSRRRTYSSWDKLPIKKVFLMTDASELRDLLSLSCALGASLSCSVDDLFKRFDRDESGWLSDVELEDAFASTGMDSPAACVALILRCFTCHMMPYDAI